MSTPTTTRRLVIDRAIVEPGVEVTRFTVPDFPAVAYLYDADRVTYTRRVLVLDPDAPPVFGPLIDFRISDTIPDPMLLVGGLLRGYAAACGARCAGDCAGIASGGAGE